MTVDESSWRTAMDMWLAMAQHSRTVTPPAYVDQCDARIRDVCDTLGVDLHDEAQRHAVQMGVVLVLCNLGPTPFATRLAAIALAPLLSPWWTGARP